MDRDGDGFVTLEDLREFLSNNGFFATEKTERELQGVMQKCDKDGDYGDNRIAFSDPSLSTNYRQNLGTERQKIFKIKNIYIIVNFVK